MQDNDEQIEFWNGEAGAKWVQQQQVMDATLQVISDKLLQQAAAQPGESALDVGCGCGDTSLALANAGLSVTGVDVSEPMLEHARSRVVGDAQVQFVCADAASATFASQYDLILSRFGVMFFAEPSAAFANLRKCARVGGRLCFVCWQAPKQNLWASLPIMSVKDLLPENEAVDPHAPGPFAFSDADRTQVLLEQAGWKDVAFEHVPWSMKLGESVAEAVDFATQIGPLAGALKELPQSKHPPILERVETALTPHKSPQGVLLDAASWMVTATV